MKIIHIIGNLRIGGAETQLTRLAVELHKTGIRNLVVTLSTEPSRLINELRHSGIQVRAADMRGWRFPAGFLRLCRILRLEADSTTVIQNWMFHANLFGSMAARMAAPGAPVCWNIRQSMAPQSPSLKLISALSARLSSHLPARILCNAAATAQNYAKWGYAATRFQIIENGFDEFLFRPDPQLRAEFRAEIGVPDSTVLVGSVGRYDPAKGYDILLQAIKAASQAIPDARFVLVGRALCEAGDLKEWLRDPAVGGRVRLLPERPDVSKVMNGLDLFCLPSLSEAFPNVVAEAMACGVPCLVTNVGDAAAIVGDSGRIVDPGNPTALAEALISFVRMERGERRALGLQARRRIEEHYSIRRAAERYCDLYTGLLVRN